MQDLRSEIRIPLAPSLQIAKIHLGYSMVKVLYLLLLSSLSISCGVSESELYELQDRNKDLSQEIQMLKKRLDDIDYLKNHSQVVIPNTELKEIRSAANGQVYKIKIQLPRNYDKRTQTYPVLYVIDAETNFGGVGYIVQRLIKDRLIPPLIVVGVAYGTDYETFYKLRSRDLTPIEDEELRMGGRIDPTGGAPKFCQFLSDELFPYIEKQYAVDGSNRTLYGHSYGGLFCTYMLLHKPELFNNYLILSPSLWFGDNLMLSNLDLISKSFDLTNVYMASGELETRIKELQTQFISGIETQNPEGLFVKAEVIQNETHRTIFGPGFTNGMRYLFEENN